MALQLADVCLKELNYYKKGNIEIQIGICWFHMHKVFSENLMCGIHEDMSGSHYAFEHCLTVPFFNEMTEKLQKHVTQKLLEVLNATV